MRNKNHSVLFTLYWNFILRMNSITFWNRIQQSCLKFSIQIFFSPEVFLSNRQAMSINRTFEENTRIFHDKCFRNWNEFVNLERMHNENHCTFCKGHILLNFIYIPKCRQQFPNSIIKILNFIKYEIFHHSLARG